MQYETRQKAVWVTLGLSCVIHVGLLLSLSGVLEPDDDAEMPQAEPSPPKKLDVQMVPETEDPEVETKVERELAVKKRRPPEEKKPEPKKNEEEKKEEKEQPVREQYNRKAVVQETNEENPEKADFVSENANKVEKETRAKETTKEFVEQSKSSKKEPETKEKKSEEEKEKMRGSKVVASRAEPPPKPRRRHRQRKPTEREEQPDERRAEKPESEKGPAPNDSEKRKIPERPDKPLPMPSVSDYNRVFDSRVDERKRKRHAEKGPGNDMFRRIEESKGAARAALENYISEVQPGNHTAVNAHADAAATYINRIHSKIHPRWGGSYLPMLDAKYGGGHPLSNPRLNAVLELVIDGKTGELEKTTVVESSGVTSYDMEAVVIVQAVAPHPKPPSEIVSPDGKVYIHWNFWRDQRQCGTFGVSLYKVDRENPSKGHRPPE